jgi:DNA-binding transcriptional MerR regulator
VNSPVVATCSFTLPPKLYRIGEVVRYSGFSRQTIHNYTTMGLIREEERTDGGHRMYGEEVFRRLAVIKTLKDSRTLGEIRDLLEREGAVLAVARPSTGDRE